MQTQLPKPQDGQNPSEICDIASIYCSIDICAKVRITKIYTLQMIISCYYNTLYLQASFKNMCRLISLYVPITLKRYIGQPNGTENKYHQQ